MFTADDNAYILRRLERNQVILVTGAGFSLMSSNANDESLPTSTKFSEKIWKLLNYTEAYDGTALSYLWDLLLNSGISESRITNLLKDTFTVKDYHDLYNHITKPFWYRIYTLNIDNLLEVIYNRQGRILQRLKYPNDENSERDQSLLKMQIIHLNGALPCNPKEIIFSRAQYAESSNNMQPLYHEFVHDYSTRTTIFVGTQLEEQIFEQYLHRRGKRHGNESEKRPRSFLILPQLSIAKINLLELYNIKYVEGTTELF
ncbi:MAG: SIR2 family protein [Bacteroidetes bacterium]|nr:SIR2 family protein [Bacteroidota bacterium]